MKNINRFWFYSIMESIVKKELSTMASKLDIISAHVEYVHLAYAVACVEMNYKVDDDDNTIVDMWSDNVIQIDKNGLYDRYMRFSGTHDRSKITARAIVRQCLRHELRHIYQAESKQHVGMKYDAIDAMGTGSAYGDIPWEKDANIYAWKEAARNEKKIAYYLILEQGVVGEADKDALTVKKTELYATKRMIQAAMSKTSVFWSHRATVTTNTTIVDLTSTIGEREYNMTNNNKAMGTGKAVMILVNGYLGEKLFKKYTDDDTMIDACAQVMNVVAKRVCKREFTVDEYTSMVEAFDATDAMQLQAPGYTELADIITRETGVKTVITSNPLMLFRFCSNLNGAAVSVVADSNGAEMTKDNVTAVITVYEGCFNEYTRITRKAICLHEVGHVVNILDGLDNKGSHVNAHASFHKASMTELMADAYAASKMGKAAVIGMLDELKGRMSKLDRVMCSIELKSRVAAVDEMNACQSKFSVAGKILGAVAAIHGFGAAVKCLSAHMYLTDAKITELVERVYDREKKSLEDALQIKLKGIRVTDDEQVIMKTAYSTYSTFMKIIKLNAEGVIDYCPKSMRSQLTSLSFLVGYDNREEFFEAVIKQLLKHESRHIHQFTFLPMEFVDCSSFSLDLNRIMAKSHGEQELELDANTWTIESCVTKKEETIAKMLKKLQERYGFMDVAILFSAIAKAWR